MAFGFDIASEILSTVASHEGVDEATLDQPLFEAVDVDALEALYAHSSAESPPPTVSFVYSGYTIIVNRPDEVEIRPGKATA